MQQANFIVYKSSAGSGKTFTLVKEYLKLALADKHSLTKAYRSVLAITFTNKAASEMKSRIIKALKEISSGTNSMLTDLVSVELAVPSAELKTRAEIVLTDILHNYSDFSIGTIDSFTHRIIRTFALDLKLPVNFQVETDADTVFRKVVSLLIGNLGKNDLVTNYLVEFSKAQIDENKNWDPEQTLIDFIKEINKEGANELVNQLGEYDISDFEMVKKQLNSVIKEYESFLKLNGEKALKLIASKQLSASAFASGGSGIYNLYVKLASLKETSEAELFGANVNKTLNDDKWYGGKASTDEKTAIDAIKNELNEIALTVLKYIRENEQRYNVFQLVYRNIYAMGLVNELAKLTNEYKTDENILFISEFNERISAVVNNEPTPFIFERLGDRYKHFLLDEFQDTSAMQWQNMLPLIDNSLGNGNLNLIVGDGKQSIYRWRNADVAQFVSLPNINSSHKNDILAEREDSLIRNFKEEVLNRNFRSESAIVKFNNHLFEHLSETVLHEELKKIYDQHAQESKSTENGFVSIDLPELIDEDTDVTNMNYVLQYIQQALADGYQYNDICVIVRQNKHGNTVANGLIEKGIPVVSADSLLLSRAEEVTVITAFLKYTANQKDFVSASAVINYLHLKGHCSEEDYVRYLRQIHSSAKSLFSVIQECKLSIDVLKITSSNLFDCCLEIIQSLKLHEANSQYVRFFLDEVLLFLQSNTSNTALFIDWWEKRIDKASVIIPEGMAAVNIMTIHASKGLEFPVVITPFLAWDIEKNQSIWVDVEDEQVGLPVALISTGKAADKTPYQPLAEKERQQQTLDSLNLLYVDFTRAVDRLHIISPQLKRNSSKNCHTWLSSFAAAQPGFDPEKQQLNVGRLSRKENSLHAKSALPPLKIEQLQFNRNEGLINIKGASSYNMNEEVTRARDYGILVHYILSKIKTLADLDSVIANAFATGDITAEESVKIGSEIKQLLSIPSIRPYFEAGVNMKNEVEVLTAEGAILRPDRVVIMNNEAIVMDYKTGKKNTSRYHAQMRDYESALKELGYSSVKKLLLYIHEQEVEVV